MSIISGNSFIRHKSLDENILVPYSFVSIGINSPGVFFSSAYKLYDHLQLCAQSPKFALLHVMKSLKKHLPENAKHIAPCMNISISISSGLFCIIYFSCSLFISLAKIILLAPLFLQKLQSCKLTMFACVLTFIGTSGAYFLKTSIIPPSAIITPSGFNSSNFFAISVISSYFSSQANILIVTYTFFPISCAYFIVFSKSSFSMSALVLNDNDDVPQYTASAPYKYAILAFSNEPAGANNSTFFILFLLFISLYYIFFFYLCQSYILLFHFFMVLYIIVFLQN